MPGQPRQTNLFVEQDAFVAETAADVRCNHAYRSLIETEAFRQSRAIDMRHLRGAVHFELIRAVDPFADDAATFERRHRLSRRSQVPAYRNRG